MLYRVKGVGPQAVTLGERLAAVGYHGAAVVAGPMVGAELRASRGFDYYDQRKTEEEGDFDHRRGSEITDVALQQVSGESGPFFLFLNYFDPHWPYVPDADLLQQWVPAEVMAISPEQQGRIWKEVLSGSRDITAAEKESMVSHYDGAIASMDRSIGRLLDGLKERGLYDSTMIVAISDHGESFGEHRMLDHGHSLYDDVLRAALIVKYPSRHAAPPSKVSTQLVDSLDVYTTICRVMGLPIRARLEGFGLHHPPHDHFAALAQPLLCLQYGSRFDRTLEAVYRDRWKLIRDDKGHRWLFHLAANPHEERNLAEAQPEQRTVLDKALDDWAARSATTKLQGTNVDLGPALKDHLHAGIRRGLEVHCLELEVDELGARARAAIDAITTAPSAAPSTAAPRRRRDSIAPSR